MKKILAIALLVVALAVIAAFALLTREQRAVLLNPPTDTDVLFWDQDARDAMFRAMDQFPFLAKSHVGAAGGEVRALPKGEPLAIGIDMAAFEKSQRSAAIVILVDGKRVYESYGLGFDGQGKWTSFSVAKSLTSTLVGAALQDGAIKSLDDPITGYITDLKGSAYDGVTIRQVLTMSSGVAWNEDYTDPASDVARFNAHKPEGDMDATVSYMRTLSRAAPPGERWHYNTGETNMIGALVMAATGKSLADYMSEKIWRPYGMEADASWLLNSTGREMGGCCFQARTRDMARFGQFVLDNGMAGGQRVVPEDWFAEATTKHFDTDRGRGYGYQWWTYPGGGFGASGIFGQGIFIDPARQLVIATNADWPVASTNDGVMAERTRFYEAVQAAVDARASKAD
ncbi:class C beta-lactamase-related serine hydrolase [Aurantiacibacter xanthus]|uniref:Class C beta-lactamase-related serine hydrolase n=1 Tax=Aurantiacibacter xanthus TaxID=1784712 RepID=A0A3A1P959_9SPHN|nr:serine hydrolase [Aurantiacibacter xanthus]RIV89529.1 class C beta-lactamase-related serine hydrolase [Aurantiacibacter xanthus]